MRARQGFMAPAWRGQPHLGIHVNINPIRWLFCAVLFFPVAGCVGNAEYRELQDKKRLYPGIEFQERAPYQTGGMEQGKDTVRWSGHTRGMI